MCPVKKDKLFPALTKLPIIQKNTKVMYLLYSCNNSFKGIDRYSTKRILLRVIFIHITA